MKNSHSEDVISATKIFVKTKLAGAEGGHDWFHVERVWKLSKKIQKSEGGDLPTIELAALLHDIADAKFHGGDEDLAIKIAREFLKSQNIDDAQTDRILFIIKNISFKNRGEIHGEIPLELKIVQDADRLDAMGAIGIARAFNFGGFRNNLMHHPDIQPNTNKTKAQYKKSDATTINHFYEKLLLLKDLMNTAAAQKMAEKRHQIMLDFLAEFLRDWDAE